MRRRRGFTLIEVMISLVILTVALLGTASVTGWFVHTVATSGRSSAASQLAADRIEEVRLQPDYGVLESFAATETGFPSLPGFTRVTQVVRVGGTGMSTDYKKITVTVTGPGLTAPVSRTVSVAAP